MKNLLSLEFGISPEVPTLTEFFELIKELDAATEVIPITAVTLYSPVHETDGVSEHYYNKDEETLDFRARGINRRVRKIVNIIDFADENLEGFINEIKTSRECLLSVRRADTGKNELFFAAPDTIKEFASLCQINGEGLKAPSSFRDDFIAHLINMRCANECYLKSKTKTKAPFSLVVRADSGVKRCFNVRSGRFTPIPQAILEKVFYDIIESDDWGSITVESWHIDHDISTIDLSFPELEKRLRDEYGLSDMPAKPGIRLSIGSTGFQCLCVSQTWKLRGSAFPSIMCSVSQKHYDNYDAESFVVDVHEGIWNRMGELPMRLAELSMIKVKNPESLISEILKELEVKKIFLQKEGETPKTKRADYIEQIKEIVMTALKAKKEFSAYDVAVELMGVTDRLSDIPKSYVDKLRNRMGKAPFCKAFDK